MYAIVKLSITLGGIGMIFYFTGTGNSLYVAQKLAISGEQVRSISEMLDQNDMQVTLADGEALGFVFPVYFYTVSDPVLEFVRKIQVENSSYVYAVITCGASIGSAGALLKDELGKRGLSLSRVDPLVVPDGAVLFYDIDTPEQMLAQLSGVDHRITSIRDAIRSRQPAPISGSAAVGKAMLASYHACMGTGKFHVQEQCISCGLCSRICPAHAIEMKNGKPAWVKRKCLKCCGCINRCPVSAIQYGKKTESRGRYVNPVLKG